MIQPRSNECGFSLASDMDRARQTHRDDRVPGCGKSMLIRLLAGFGQPSCGTIKLDGFDEPFFMGIRMLLFIFFDLRGALG